MLTTNSIIKKIKDNIDSIKKFGVKKIGLFGSYIHDKQTLDSDIDILVEFKSGQKTFDNYMDLKFYLEEIFKLNVDLVVTEAIKPDLKPNNRVISSRFKTSLFLIIYYQKSVFFTLIQPLSKNQSNIFKS